MKIFTPSKLGETWLQKMQNDESFFGEKPLKIAHGLNFTPKIILASLREGKNKEAEVNLKLCPKTLAV